MHTLIVVEYAHCTCKIEAVSIIWTWCHLRNWMTSGNDTLQIRIWNRTRGAFTEWHMLDTYIHRSQGMPFDKCGTRSGPPQLSVWAVLWKCVRYDDNVYIMSHCLGDDIYNDVTSLCHKCETAVSNRTTFPGEFGACSDNVYQDLCPQPSELEQRSLKWMNGPTVTPRLKGEWACSEMAKIESRVI